MKKRKLILLVFSSLVNHAAIAQHHSPTQIIKGIIADADSRKPIPGATIAVTGINKIVVTDSTGFFRLDPIPVGRQSLTISHTGYESQSLPDIIVSSGKEIFISGYLVEKIKLMNEVIVKSSKGHNNSSNEFASASVRSFSMEESKRYPVTGFDPARIVQNFAGVSLQEDNANTIIVRGNSPKGILWRLEGIEIPNPNHFGSFGSSGGHISMLNSSTLDKSDFYTGAFPAEFGNALSGVFDLKFRNGNRDKHEHSLMLGTLGIEAASEGPFAKGHRSSYLFNMRYSTMALMKGFAEIEGVTPDYQDASFKLFFPMKKGDHFSVFGLGGTNKSLREPENNPFGFDPLFTQFKVEEKARTGIIGAAYQVYLTKRAFLKTIVVATADKFINNTDTLNYQNNNEAIPTSRTRFLTTTVKGSLQYNNKINSRHVLQAGAIATNMGFEFSDKVYNFINNHWESFYQSDGSTMFYQAYVQWKWRPAAQLTVTTGTHGSMLALNKTTSIEPRFSLAYRINAANKIILSAGLHSKPEHLATYFFQRLKDNQPGTNPNKQLDLTKAAHWVISYEKRLKNIIIKTEGYYQHLYNVPVEKSDESFFSLLNATDAYDLYDVDSSLINKGKGKNYGIDISIERAATKNYYFIFTGSLFKSTYTTYSGGEFNTKFNRGYQLNLVGNKEWKLDRNNLKSVTLNGKILTSGALRESPVDEQRSAAEGKIVYQKDQYFTLKGKPYFRFDIGVSYKINRRKTTHSIMLDIQNLFNYKNVVSTSYNPITRKTSEEYGLGIFPLLNYRVEF